MAANGLTTCHLERLPNELLLHIIERMPNPGALYNFMKAYPRSKVVVQSHPKPQEVLMGVIQRPGMPLQLQKIICTTMAIRHRKAALVKLEKYLETNLEGLSPPPVVACGKDLVGVLQDLVTLLNDTDTLEETFLTTRLENAVQLQRTRSSGADNSETFSRPSASPTELHRIRRAFWRLQLYSDLFHHPGREFMAYEPDDIYRHGRFFEAITVWELEELECAYYHVKEQFKVWRDPNSACYAPALANRLLERFQCNKDGWDGYDRSKRTSEAHVSNAVGFYREMLASFFSNQSRTAWSDTPEASKPSAGYQYFMDNSEQLGVGEFSYFRMSPVSCFLDWGFCMWDRSRLEALHLLDSPSQHPWADPSKSHRYDCAHCPDRSPSFTSSQEFSDDEDENLDELCQELMGC